LIGPRDYRVNTQRWVESRDNQRHAYNYIPHTRYNTVPRWNHGPGNSRASQVMKLPLSRAGFIKVTCQGADLSALIDSGACKSLLASGFYHSLRNKPRLDTRRLTTFAAANSETLGSVGQVDLPILIGSRYIKEGLFSTQDIKVPPRSQLWVDVKLRDKHKSIFTGASVQPNTRHSDGAILPTRQLVKIARGSARVLCRNPGHQPLTVPAGTKVGLAQVAEAETRFPLPATPPNVVNTCYRHSDEEYWQALSQIDFSTSILNNDQINQIRDVIWQERDVMSINGSIGKLKGYAYQIKLANDAPFDCRPYRLSPPARDVMRRELNLHYDQGVITPYISQYNSPALIIKKPGFKNVDISKAKVRLVLDLRRLNSRCVPEKYSLPHIVESLTQLDKDSLNYISKIDFSRAFSQVPLSEDSYKYVTFKTDGLNSWSITRLPMGFINSPAAFQRVIDNLIPVSLKKNVIAYIDDILLCTSTFEEHVSKLRELLNVISRNGFMLDISKSALCQPSMSFLGYTLSRDGISMKGDKLQAILRL